MLLANFPAVSERRSPTDREARLRRLLPVEIASWISLLVLAVAIAATHHYGWDNALFLVGLAIGAAGAVYVQLYYRLAPRLIGFDGRAQFGRSKMARLQYTVSYAVVGVFIGVISAAFNIAWAELVAIIFLAVLWTGTLLALPLLARRLQKRRPSNLTDGTQGPSGQPD